MEEIQVIPATGIKSDVDEADETSNLTGLVSTVKEKFRNAQFDLKHNGTNVPYTISEDGTSITFCAVSFSPRELQITKCAEGQH